MARSYYSDYVAHMMRFYILSVERPGVITTKVEKANVDSVKAVLSDFTKEEGDILLLLYDCEYLPQNVERVSNSRHLKTGYIWKLLAEFERRCARDRGLI